MKKYLRLAVFIMCIAWLFSLLGCGKEKPFILDGPGMERSLWSAFTIARCNERFEPIYSYTVKYDIDADVAYLYEGQDEENCIQFRQETVSALLNLNLLSLPDEEPVTGNFLGLSVVNSEGQVSAKRISRAMETEILELLDPYLEELKKMREEGPTMLDGPGMEYVSPWTGFALSRSDSYAQYNFSFTVTEIDGDSEPLISGACRDEDGNEYEAEGVPISPQTLWELRDLHPEDLPDAVDTEAAAEMLDGSNITFSITLRDGTTEKKNISAELSLEIYQLLLPYFTGSQS